MKICLSQRGGALLITLAIMMVLTMAAIIAVDSAQTDIELSFNQVRSDQAFYIAQAGFEHAVTELDNDHDWRAGFSQYQFGDGAYTVILIDSSVQASLGDTVIVRSLGQATDASTMIEVTMLEAKYHPLYYHAIYAGNETEYDPSVDTQTWYSEMTFGGTGTDRDIIDGDIFFNGHINFSEGSELDGSAYAGGDYDGNPPTGSTNTNQDYLEPPDLLAEDYATNADFFVGSQYA